MKKIFYGVLGEGLGHASRAFTLIEKLSKDFEVHVFTSKDAYGFFKTVRHPYLHPIDSVNFHYNEKGEISYLKTCWNLYNFLNQAKKSFNYIVARAEKLQPQFFITDFEPLTVRVAHLLGHKVISIDNQHKFTDCSLKTLPLKYKIKAKAVGVFVNQFIPLDYFDTKIISTFHYDLEIVNDYNAYLTNVFIKDKLAEIEVSNEGFLLCYVKAFFGQTILCHLQELSKKFDIPIKIYCDDISNLKSDKDKHISVHKIDYKNFIKDLASCSAILSTAGNQLIGEARFLGKPILAIPIPYQFEQSINSYYLNQFSVFGESVHMNNLSMKVIVDFLNNKKGDAHRINGVNDALKIISNYF